MEAVQSVLVSYQPAIDAGAARVGQAAVGWQRLALAAVLALYVGLAVLYSIVNPLFEAPDESWHYGFVWHLRTGRGLPVATLSPTTPPVMQEALQPPLYYVLAAGLTWWVPTEDLSTVVEQNPAGGIGRSEGAGATRQWVLLRPDRFPYSGELLGAHLARLLSVALGALTVLATWLVARELAPDRPAVWILAAALNAFVPQFLFISSAVSNDALAACTAAWGLLLAIRIARGNLTVRRTVALGLVAGLGALAKLSVLGLIPLGLVALTPGAWRSGPSRWVRHAALFLGVALAVCGWWYARNLVLYGDPLAFRTFVLASGGTGEASFDLAGLPGELRTLVESSWALFGWCNVHADPWLYLVYDLLAAVALCGLPFHVASVHSARTGSNRRAEPALPPLSSTQSGVGPSGGTSDARATGGKALLPAGIAALWIVLIGGAFVRYQFYLVAWQGRLLFPALAAACAFLGIGLASLPLGRVRSPAAAGLVVVLAAIATWVPYQYIAPAYASPPLVTSVSLAQVRHRVYARFGGGPELLGYDLPRDEAAPDEDLEVALYWRAPAPMSRNYVVSIQAFDAAGVRLAQQDTYVGGSYPTRIWKAGDIIRETYRLRLPANAVGPAVGQLGVAVYAPGEPSLRAVDERGRDLGQVNVARFKVVGSAQPATDAKIADLGGDLRLVSYELDARTVRPGDVFRGELDWTALHRPGKDYTVFVQMLGPTGLVAQYDSQPVHGTYPTSFWGLGELVHDEFALPVSRQVAPGEYRLVAGMYDLATGRRLPTTKGDSISLGTVNVVS